jgi:hypothetical protein
MQRRVEALARLNHPKSDVNKFAHHRPDNQLGRFTRRFLTAFKQCASELSEMGGCSPSHGSPPRVSQEEMFQQQGRRLLFLCDAEVYHLPVELFICVVKFRGMLAVPDKGDLPA